MSIIEYLFNIFAPHECLVCRTEGDLLCQKCSGNLKNVPERCYACGRWGDGFLTCKSCRRRSPLYSVHAAVLYEGAAKELLHALKFARARAGAATAARILSPACRLSPETIITYAPTSHKRMRERGYDQAALIAKELAKQLGLPCLPLLARTGDQRQLGRQREVRKKQMADAFRSLETIELRDKHILIVDDVLTTGATCEAAARVLRASGAKRVSAAVFAVA